jgi:hypothetical protein
MIERVQVFNNGAYVTMERLFPSGYREVRVRGGGGELIDKITVDDYSVAMDYWRSFCAVAKAGANNGNHYR